MITVRDGAASALLWRLRNRLPSAGPLFLTVLLANFGASLALQYARWNYTTLTPIGGDAANTLLFKSDDSLWIRVRPELDQYHHGIGTWPHTFTDLFEVWLHAFDANPYTDWILSPSVYPPLVHLLVLPFSQISWSWFLAGYLTIGIGGWFLMLRRILVLTRCPWPTLGAVALELFTLPIAFGLDRGNIEVIVGLLVAFSILPALKPGVSKTVRVWPIVLAGFLKISPIVMLGLVRWRRRSLIELVVSGLACAAASVLALWLMQGPTVDSAHAFVDLSRAFGTSGSDPFVFRSTLWGTESAAATVIAPGFVPIVPSGMVCFGIIALLAFVAAVLPFYLWERIALIGASMVLFSADGPAYRLLYLLIAAAVFLGVTWHRRAWYFLVMAALLAAALAPRPWIPELPWAWTLVTGTSLVLVIVVVLGAGIWRIYLLRGRRLPHARSVTTKGFGV